MDQQSTLVRRVSKLEANNKRLAALKRLIVEWDSVPFQEKSAVRFVQQKGIAAQKLLYKALYEHSTRLVEQLKVELEEIQAQLYMYDVDENENES